MDLSWETLLPVLWHLTKPVWRGLQGLWLKASGTRLTWTRRASCLLVPYAFCRLRGMPPTVARTTFFLAPCPPRHFTAPSTFPP